MIDVPAPQRLGEGSRDDDNDDDGGSGEREREEVSGLGRIVYKCRAAVVDLDMKSMRKLPAWLALEREIVANYDDPSLSVGRGKP